MKSISIILASILCASSPLMAQENASERTEVVQTESRYQLGSEVIGELRSNYEQGQYDEFLSEMDEAYRQAKEENQLEGLIEIRKESGVYTVPQDKLLDGFEVIQKEKNQRLLKIAADDSLFAAKVRSAAEDLPSDQRAAVVELSSLRVKGPGMGNSSDENRLIEIDLENQYKNIHLDSLAAMGEEVQNRKEKHFILEMQRMDQMVAASADFQDKGLKSTVEKAASNYDLRLAKIYDLSDLNDLARGKVKPETSMEEKVASVVAEAHAKFSDLNQELLAQTN